MNALVLEKSHFITSVRSKAQIRHKFDMLENRNGIFILKNKLSYCMNSIMKFLFISALGEAL